MYRIFIVFLVILSVFLPIGVIAGTVEEATYFNDDIENSLQDSRFDLVQSRIYQVDGHFMEHLGFMDGALVDVVPTEEIRVGDVIAFDCADEKCDGAYIKRVTRKKDSCYWVEGRYDVWEENGQKKQSMDSRTTYGWLCDDEITIFGIAFMHENA